MSNVIEIKVPDIGDFEGVEVIEVLVQPGDEIEKEQSLITLESDKATMDIPSPCKGIVKNVSISVGDKVSQGTLILTMESVTIPKDKQKKVKSEEPAPYQVTPSSAVADIHAEVAVLGAGPGGYTAAFRSADLGKKTVLIERYPDLGGVCLNVGCIPSKALLHIARVIAEIEELKEHGIDLGNSNADKKSIRAWTAGVLSKLTGGLRQMAKQRMIEVIQGTGNFISTHTIEVRNGNKTTTVSFDQAIIAAGSQAATIPGIPSDPRIMDSTSALLLETIPERLLVIGGGIIGLEMATVYDSLGSKITVVEMLDSLMADCDKDIVRPLQNRIKKRYENIYLKTSVKEIRAMKKYLEVTFNGKDAPVQDNFDAILVAVGRRPNGKNIGAENAGVHVDEVHRSGGVGVGLLDGLGADGDDVLAELPVGVGVGVPVGVV